MGGGKIAEIHGQQAMLLRHWTQPSVKAHAGAGCWRHKRRLKTSLRFVIAPFANLGDFDEILQLGISDLHSTFCKS